MLSVDRDEVKETDYRVLARALLDAGDPPASVARFLRVEYGLKAAEAKEAIARGRLLIIEKSNAIALEASVPRRGYRDTLGPRATRR